MHKLLLLSTFTLLSFFSKAQFGFERKFDILVDDGIENQINAWTGGMNYCQFSNIDLDFDGDKDLFVFDRSCNKVLTFIQNGAEGESDFVYAPQYEDDFPADLRDWALLVDYNCDGLEDIFTYVLGGCRVFKNVGSIAEGNVFELESPILQTTVDGDLEYMFISSVDIPAFVDIDGDSDIDVLSFGVLGTAMEYHRNMSVENHGDCNTLEFITKNECWGRFTESTTSNEVTLWDTLVYPCNGTLDNPESWRPNSDRNDDDRHTGSSVLALDMNNSTTMELVIGDITYTNLNLLWNSGTEPNINSGMDDQDVNFPSNSVPVDLNLFPAAYHVDINNDGNRDLLVSPAAVLQTEDRNSVWGYENTDEDLTPVFEFIQEDFIQHDMIDHGKGSLPVFFDQDGDGLKDLLVSVHGQFDAATSNQISRIAYYRNIGTAAEPRFSLVTEDWQNLSALEIGAGLSFYPTFGDLDGDGDEDMVLGEYIGNCYYMENTGGAGSNAVFSAFSTLKDNTGADIIDGTFAYPQLVDLDRDSDLDLVIGRRNGSLIHYENTGSASDYEFELQTLTLGGVDVSEWWSIEGQAIPQFIDIDNEYHLVLGSKKGTLHYYDNIDDNLDGDFNLVDSTLEDIHIGTFSCPAIYELSDNNTLTMMLGNQRGGLALYQSVDIDQIGIKETDANWLVKVYPNPTSGYLKVDFGGLAYQDLKHLNYQLYDLRGSVLLSGNPTENQIELDVSDLKSGTYLLKIVGQDKLLSKKIVIH